MRSLLLLCAVGFAASCGATRCKQTPIVIVSHPTKPRPAGRVTVGCDGKVLADIVADEIAY